MSKLNHYTNFTNICTILCDENKLNHEEIYNYTNFQMDLFNQNHIDKLTPEILKYIIQNMIDINKSNNSGKKIIHYVCEKYDVNMLHLLSDYDIDYEPTTQNDDFYNPIHIACKYNNYDVIKFLIDKNVNINIPCSCLMFPIHLACEHQSYEIVKLLIDNRADITQINTINQTPLHIACKYNDFNTIKLLINNSANVHVPDFFFRNPMHVACQYQSYEVIEFLIQNGANVNAYFDGQNISYVQKNSYEENSRLYFVSYPLHIACMYNSLDTIKLLVDNGALITNVDIINQTALHVACRYQNYESIEYLIKKKCDINCVDIYGWTPFNIACRYQSYKTINKIINKHKIHQSENIIYRRNNNNIIMKYDNIHVKTEGIIHTKLLWNPQNNDNFLEHKNLILAFLLVLKRINRNKLFIPKIIAYMIIQEAIYMIVYDKNMAEKESNDKYHK